MSLLYAIEYSLAGFVVFGLCVGVAIYAAIHIAEMWTR